MVQLYLIRLFLDQEAEELDIILVIEQVCILIREESE